MRTVDTVVSLNAAQVLREQWRAASMSAVWLRPRDWYLPEIDAVVDAVAQGRDPSAALERLGRARCEAGVGLGETLDDLICLFQVTGQKQAPWRMIRLVADAWAEKQAETTTVAAYTDPVTDLVTLDYLRIRMREIFEECQSESRLVSREYCLIIVDTAVAEVDRWRTMQRGFSIAGALHAVFNQGQTLATAGNTTGRAIVLSRRTERLGTDIGRLRDSLAQTMRMLAEMNAARVPARIWVEPLPEDYAMAVDLMTELAR